MTETVIACVRVGARYPFEYVTKMRHMVERHMTVPFTMVCLTDQPERCSGVAFVDISAAGLLGWWAKMMLFEPQWRAGARVVYLDLDTVIIRDMTALAKVPGEFAICAAFSRIHNPCKYNSSVMVIGRNMGDFIWREFERRRESLMMEHAAYGDQACIEELYPRAQLLQQVLPKDFFCNYRDLTQREPSSPAAIINFGGHHKPDNCKISWVQTAWA